MKNYKGIAAAAARSRSLTEADVWHEIRLDLDTGVVWVSTEPDPVQLGWHGIICGRNPRGDIRKLVNDAVARWQIDHYGHI